jgi:hypothetical protein
LILFAQDYPAWIQEVFSLPRALAKVLKTPRRLMLLAILVALIAAPIAQGTIQKYFGPGTVPAFTTENSGNGYWIKNEVWRPVGSPFAAWFDNGVGTQLGYAESTWNNPFWAQGSFGYDWGVCYNSNSSGVSSVTCQVNT